MSKRIAFVTLGCAKNEVDSAHMQQDLIRAGYTIAGPEDECDAVVVNTCAFIQPAIEESLDAIFELAAQDAVVSGDTKLVVCGCLPSRFGDDLSAELTEPDRFVPCKDESNLVAILDDLLDVPTSANAHQEDVEFTYEPSEYVKISDGCSRFCSFCTIPFIRGRYHSFPLEQVAEEVRQKVQGGAKEIVLIAQDSGIWGTDFEEPDTLAHLLGVIAEEHPSTWFRVMYLQPAGVTDELLDVMASHENVCEYFDIPLQHCSAEILSSMNREGSREEIESLLSRIRTALPNVTLRTTLIVGYPGETDDQFEDLCDFVSEADFDYVGIFPYSAEDGTRAAKLPDQIDEDVKMERLQELRDIADAVSTQRISSRIGSKQDVLVLGFEEDGQLYGRTQLQAPDVDGVTYVEEGTVGEFLPAKIVDTLLYEMEAGRD